MMDLGNPTISVNKDDIEWKIHVTHHERALAFTV
jgi:hypothetical protein